MKRDPIFRTTGRLFAGLLLLSTLASANSIIVATGVDWNRGENITIAENGLNPQSYYAGVIYITLTQATLQYNRETLCVDLFTDINPNVVYGTTVLNPADVSGKNLDRVAWLVDNALRPSENPAPFNHSLLPSGDWVASPAQGAGIQLAIWDIVHDGGDGFAAGQVQVPSTTDTGVLSMLGWATTYESLSLHQSSPYAFIYKNVWSDGTTPAQMLAGPQFLDGGPAPPIFPPFNAPEPSTFLMVGAALVVAGSFRRNRNRRQAGSK
ncbi:MAG: PEP-CTERM sorting domain-containing protein [Acidobacteriia bacterium]|nr:PEP-CTERM sorting domain-containing protein [Terriglobia bacterium]